MLSSASSASDDVEAAGIVELTVVDVAPYTPVCKCSGPSVSSFVRFSPLFMRAQLSLPKKRAGKHRFLADFCYLCGQIAN